MRFRAEATAYWSSDSTDAGAWLAWASIAWPAWARIEYFVYSTISGRHVDVADPALGGDQVLLVGAGRRQRVLEPVLDAAERRALRRHAR